MDTKKAVVIVAAVVAILGSFVSIYLNRAGRSPRIVLNSYQALGEVAAEETSKLLDQKAKVVIIAYDTKVNSNPVEEAKLKAFGDRLKTGGITISSTEKFKLTPMERMATGGAVPRERFLQILESHPNVDAIVLFVAFPPLTETDLDRLERNGPKLVLISGYMPGYKNLLSARVVQLAIVPRFDSAAERIKQPQTLRQWFDRDYVIITPDNLATLPY